MSGPVLVINRVDSTLATRLAGEDLTRDYQRTAQPYGYESVSNGTDVVLGTVGAAGDLLHRIIVPAALIAAVTLKDGATTVLTLPIGFAAGSYELNLRCLTAWKVTAGASDTVLCIGDFT